MKAKLRRCCICKTRHAVELMYRSGFKMYCSAACGAKLGMELMRKDRDDKDKAFRRQTRIMKEAAKTRTTLYGELQKQVNWFVRMRDFGEPCCTCGTTNDIKYDAGHYRSVGSCKDLRFELTNIHRQCSRNCNVMGSGMRKEYSEFIVAMYGQDHLDWLDGPHTPLKDRFPTHDDIRHEIRRYKQITEGMKL